MMDRDENKTSSKANNTHKKRTKSLSANNFYLEEPGKTFVEERILDHQGPVSQGENPEDQKCMKVLVGEDLQKDNSDDYEDVDSDVEDDSDEEYMPGEEADDIEEEKEGSDADDEHNRSNSINHFRNEEISEEEKDYLQESPIKEFTCDELSEAQGDPSESLERPQPHVVLAEPWVRKVTETEPSSTFCLWFEHPSDLFELFELEEFPIEYLQSLKSTLTSAISLPSDILVSRVWEQFKERFAPDPDDELSVVEKMTEDNESDSQEVNETDLEPVIEHSHLQDSSISIAADLLNDSDLSINARKNARGEKLQNIMTERSLIVQLTLEPLINPCRMLKFLEDSKIPWDCQQGLSWFRTPYQPEKHHSTEFHLCFKTILDFSRFIEEDASFPWDFIISITSRPSSAILSKDILSPAGWRKAKLEFEAQAGERKFRKHCDGQLTVIIFFDPTVSPCCMEAFIQSSIYVESYRYIRHLVAHKT